MWAYSPVSSYYTLIIVSVLVFCEQNLYKTSNHQEHSQLSGLNAWQCYVFVTILIF